MNFSALLTGLRNLDDNAIAHFIEKYSSLVMAFIQKKVDAKDAEDAAQEFLYHILKINLFEKFGGETEDAFKAYLVKSALNFSFNWRMKQLKINEPLEIFDEANPNHWRILKSGDVVFEEFLEKETSHRLRDAIGGLAPQYRRVIELKLLDYSNGDIAEILDAPLGSVNSWYTRALRLLGENLKDLNTKGPASDVIE
jgi:RNA polymerase sigma factor (sigma-70 family)